MRRALGRWLHGQLEVELRAGGDTASAKSLATLLQHATALLAADTDQRLWEPLTRALLSGVADRLEDIGRLDLVGRTLTAVAKWMARLPEAEAEEPFWLHQRCVLVDDQGDLLRSQGNLPGALAAHREALAVGKRLAEADPSNAGWQHDLSWSLKNMAELHERQGDRAAALPLAEESLAIAERLAALDPTNAKWQNDVAVSRALVARLRDGVG